MKMSKQSFSVRFMIISVQKGKKILFADRVPVTFYELMGEYALDVVP